MNCHQSRVSIISCNLSNFVQRCNRGEFFGVTSPSYQSPLRLRPCCQQRRIKAGLISEVFFPLAAISKNWCPITAHSISSLLRWIVLRAVIWQAFWDSATFSRYINFSLIMALKNEINSVRIFYCAHSFFFLGTKEVHYKKHTHRWFVAYEKVREAICSIQKLVLT
jgi:hypothetical protein